jgi:hypothetical protein
LDDKISALNDAELDQVSGGNNASIIPLATGGGVSLQTEAILQFCSGQLQSLDHSVQQAEKKSSSQNDPFLRRR